MDNDKQLINGGRISDTNILYSENHFLYFLWLQGKFPSSTHTPYLRKSIMFSKKIPLLQLKEHGFPGIYYFMVRTDLPEKMTYTISLAKKVKIYIKIVALKNIAQ